MSGASPLSMDELELDALTELVNIGVSRAAARLRVLVGEEVLLTVPAISTVTPDQAADMIGGARGGKLVAVEQAFAGDLSGRAMLIFPELSSLELARAVAGDDTPADELPQIAPEALLATGDLVLQSCLGTIGDLLQRRLDIDVPHIVDGRARELFPRVGRSAVLFVYINFSLRGRRIRGYIALLMDMASLRSMKLLVAGYVPGRTS